jgi:predicted lipoprotein
MLKKIIKCGLTVVIVAFVIYNSIYFKKLSEVKAAAKATFDPVSYARTYLDKSLLPSANKAPQADALIAQLKNNPSRAFKTDAHALDIGNTRFFMVLGEGVITNIDENDVYITTDGKQALKIATEYIFGNALRDAPGVITVNDFTNSMDLNNVSAEVNKLVRNEILPPFKSKAKKGDRIGFAGAFELNQEHMNLANIEVIPVALTIKN